MKVTGKAYIKIELGGRFFSCDVLVAPELRAPFLLGLNWLRQEDAIIDLSRNVLYVGKIIRTTIPLVGTPLSGDDLAIVDPEKLQHQVPSQHLRPFHHIIRENARIFSPSGGGLPRTRSVRHTIKLTTDQPFRLPPYQYSEVKRKEIEKQV